MCFLWFVSDKAVIKGGVDMESRLDRLPLNIARRSLGLGLITGCCLRGVEFIKRELHLTPKFD